ncbi:S1 RNA-binding domain-containing protein [Rubripirellula sp.]|nr:S1 RNA-binding domain-containing protein [Rubripirellula sp.]
MSVDFDAIAQRGRCDVSSLRLAVPLLEQGFLPPFLARYRRDELGGVSESSLWELLRVLQADQEIQRRRSNLMDQWEQTTLRDPALGNALKSSRSLRMLNRLGRRLKRETGDTVSSSTQLAARLLNPEQGDADDALAIASKLEGITNAEDAVAGLDAALAERLAGDPRVISAAVRWLSRNAKIHVAKVHDPHLAEDDEPTGGKKKKKRAAAKAESSSGDTKVDAAAVAATAEGGSSEQSQVVEPQQESESQPAVDSPQPSNVSVTSELSKSSEVESSLVAVTDDSTKTESESVDASTIATGEDDVSKATEAPAAEAPVAEAPVAEAPVAEAPVAESPVAESPAAETQAAAVDAEATNAQSSADNGKSNAADGAVTAEASADSVNTADSDQGDNGSEGTKSGNASSKKQKKVSPRQRRRRWLVSVLKPLAGKRFAGDKLSAFQVVMLGRALRSQVVVCAFEYNATKLVAELQRVAGSINRHFESKLQEIILQHEGVIREAGETAWWDDLHEKASTKLVSITSDHLARQVNRGAVEGRVVLAIDAVGPRTAATSIVCADGRILHNEDLPCQLSTAMRTQAVNRLGELIHSYHVDLIVISNGPSRRATMVALGDLIQQSPEGSVRWTLADRNGADVYASSSIADDEMRSTPRRFRAAAWLAFSVLQPAQAFAKVDPLKLRLSSFQRELEDDQLINTLDHVIVSGASRGGVDVNSAPVSWLTRIPGVSPEVAAAIDQARRETLFGSRESLSQLDQWGAGSGSRQALPFLRVFGSEKTLDGTLIHPDDYVLAEKLANALEIELPPASPPGYVAPDFTTEEDPTTKNQISEAPVVQKPSEVKDFTNAAEEAADFSINDSSAADHTDSASEQVAAMPEDGDLPADETVSTLETESSSTESSNQADDASVATQQKEEEAAADEEASVDTIDSTPATAQDEAGQADTESSQQDTVSEDAAASDTSGSVLDKESIPEPVRRVRPEAAKVDKCVKEWQVGSRRSHQLVQWLCDPFGDSDSSGSSPAVLSGIPSTKTLKSGEKVIGVVVGVMPFGVFVELAPDCSGLVHVSRISDSYVEDLHEAVQVGDVLTAWVTGIDEKRRRVALSAVSPEREAELEAARQANRANNPRGSRGSSEGNRRGRGGQENRGGGERQSGSGQGSGDSKRGGKPSGSAGRGDARGGSQRRDGGNRGRSNRSGGGYRGRDRKPESYGVVSKAESKPISDAMQKGEEPLRSFGDLMQFFGSSTASKPAKPKAEPKIKAKDEPKPQESAETTTPVESKPPTQSDVVKQDVASEQSQSADHSSDAAGSPKEES